MNKEFDYMLPPISVLVRKSYEDKVMAHCKMLIRDKEHQKFVGIYSTIETVMAMLERMGLLAPQEFEFADVADQLSVYLQEYWGRYEI